MALITQVRSLPAQGTTLTYFNLQENQIVVGAEGSLRIQNTLYDGRDGGIDVAAGGSLSLKDSLVTFKVTCKDTDSLSLDSSAILGGPDNFMTFERLTSHLIGSELPSGTRLTFHNFYPENYFVTSHEEMENCCLMASRIVILPSMSLKTTKCHLLCEEILILKDASFRHEQTNYTKTRHVKVDRLEKKWASLRLPPDLAIRVRSDYYPSPRK